MKKLTPDFYLREDVLQIARDLIGKELITNINSTITSGIITETEAYAGVVDRASHAYGGRRTNRTETMYAAGGISYVYLCYGIHHLFNVVTNVKEVPHAVLIRNIQPLKGLETILERRRKKKIDKTLSTGPGTMSEALGIKTLHNGFDLTGDTVWIEDAGITIANETVKITPRIGVDYAGEDAKLPYRFLAEKIII
ncbi:MAG: DNA-3-methyladenine glycosylase [Bacteroidetes bacterium]|nr:MAG: DNA-3-methyladenine glycosylase [Bacteroidota bacterium]